jgi:hypothetical protein
MMVQGARALRFAARNFLHRSLANVPSCPQVIRSLAITCGRHSVALSCAETTQHAALAGFVLGAVQVFPRACPQFRPIPPPVPRVSCAVLETFSM